MAITERDGSYIDDVFEASFINFGDKKPQQNALRERPRRRSLGGETSHEYQEVMKDIFQPRFKTGRAGSVSQEWIRHKIHSISMEDDDHKSDLQVQQPCTTSEHLFAGGPLLAKRRTSTHHLEPMGSATVPKGFDKGTRRKSLPANMMNNEPPTLKLTKQNLSKSNNALSGTGTSLPKILETKESREGSPVTQYSENTFCSNSTSMSNITQSGFLGRHELGSRQGTQGISSSPALAKQRWRRASIAVNRIEMEVNAMKPQPKWKISLHERRDEFFFNANAADNAPKQRTLNHNIQPQKAVKTRGVRLPKLA